MKLSSFSISDGVIFLSVLFSRMVKFTTSISIRLPMDYLNAIKPAKLKVRSSDAIMIVMVFGLYTL